MSAPLNRDQQIELMKTSAKRHEARISGWMANRTVSEAIRHPAPGQSDETVYTQKHKRIAC